MIKGLIDELAKHFSNQTIVLLFESCFSTVKLYSDIRLHCYKVIRVNNPSDLEMLKINPTDVVITDIKNYDQIKYKYNINYFVIQNSSSDYNTTYNCFHYNCIKLDLYCSECGKPFEIINNNNNVFNTVEIGDLHIKPPCCQQQKKCKDDKIVLGSNNTDQIQNNNIDLKQPSVYIVIPTYNQEKFTVKCFNSINKYYDKNYDIHIVWVDNGSNEKSIDTVTNNNSKLENLKNKIHFIRFEDPIGYVKSTNSGIKFALSENADYIVLQNNDTIVTAGWLNPLIKVLKDNSDVVGSGPITNSPLARQGFDKIKINVLKDLPDFTNKTTTYITNILHELYKDKAIIFSDENSVDVTLAFYCTAFKKSIFEQIGLLDESFGLGYGDDVDFCQRIFLSNYKLAFIPESYVLHNHRTTFKSIFTDQQIKDIIKARILQCKIRNTFNTNKSKKIAVYTCIIGEYDKLLSYENIDLQHCDYFCFTDAPVKNKGFYWNVIDINPFKKYIKTLNCCKTEAELNTKLARYIKINPHLFFPNYQYSMWVDGNINILENVNDFIKTIPTEYSMFIAQHPLRDCIYDEIEACRQLNKETDENLNKVKEFLINEQYPLHNGLVQSGIIIRKHNDKKCIDVMNQWWNMIEKYSKRDQLSFNYICWKLEYAYYTIPWDSIINKFIRLLFKHSKKQSN